MENISKRSKEGIILENGKKLIFEEIEGKRIYNPTAPFKIGDEVYMVCRVEDRSSGKSMAMLFQLKQDKWFLVKDAPIFNLEDPFITHFKNGVLFGGVDVKWHNGKIEYLKTNFYYGKSFFDLDPQTPFAQGPLMMKDIRIVEIDNGFGVFTRPQGGEFLRGRICYLEIDDINDLKDEGIYNKGKLIELNLKDNEWIGSNEIHCLDDNHLGILGHLAFEDDEGNLHYSAITFIFNRINFNVQNLTIIAKRNNFPKGSFKEKRLKDVVFPGGLVKTNDGNYTLYCGLSDEEIGEIKIKNPFEL